MKKKLLVTAICFMVSLAAVSWAEVVIRTQVEPTGGPYTSVSSDNRIESQNVGTNYLGQSLKMRYANASRIIIPFCRFDLSSVAGLDLSGATFSHTITWESRAGTYTLDVWGLIDGDADYWDASTLTWTTATGSLGWLTAAAGTYTDFTVNTAKWQNLGTVTFTVAAGSPNLTVTTNTTNCNLDSFLAADTNGLVTLALMSNVNNHWCDIASSDQVAAGTFPEAYAPSLTIPIGASNPLPADGSTIVDYASLTQLCWDNQSISRYEVWFGAGDANELDYQSVLTNIATIDDPALSACADIPAGMLPLTAPQTYTWVLDGYVYPASDPNHTGDPNQMLTINLFQFATSAVPSVDTDPSDQYVYPTETATFTAIFDAITPVTAVIWYKDDVAVDTGDADVTVTLTNGTANQYTSTLTIDNAEAADEGTYYCVAENAGGFSDPTAAAYLVVKRMLAHWDFNGDADDETGVYHGTLMGDPNFVDDGTRYAMIFDGVDDYVDLPDGFENFKPGVTLAMWVNPTAATSYAKFIDLGNGAPSDNIFFTRAGTTTWLEFQVYAGTTSGGVVSLGSGTLTEGVWQFFVATLDEAGNAVLYKNGVPIQTSTIEIPHVVTRTSNLIGASNWTEHALYNGLIDDMQVYNYALSDDQIAQVYADAAGNFCRYKPEYDYNNNCIVDLGDFAIFAASWLECGLHPQIECP